MVRRSEPLTCVVFDFDGVLVDSNAVKRKAYFEALGDIPGSADVIAEVLARPTVEPVDRYHTMGRIVSLLRARAFFAAEDSARIIAERTERYASICARDLPLCDEIPGASQLLAKLSEIRPLYVNSATPEHILRTNVAERGWPAYFRDALGSPATKAANLLRIALAEGIETRRILFVGVVIEEGRFEHPVERVVADLSDLPSLVL